MDVRIGKCIQCGAPGFRCSVKEYTVPITEAMQANTSKIKEQFFKNVKFLRLKSGEIA